MEDRGLNQSEVARELRVERQTVNGIVRGRAYPSEALVHLLEVISQAPEALREEPARPYGSASTGTNPLEQFDDGELSAKARKLISAGHYQSAKPFVDELARRGVNSDRVADLANAAAEIAVESVVAASNASARRGAEKRRPVPRESSK